MKPVWLERKFDYGVRISKRQVSNPLEVKEWLEEQCGDGWGMSPSDGSLFATFYFADKAKALLFKLTWGGAQ